MVSKIYNFERGNREPKSKRLCKKVEDQKVWKQIEDGMELNGCYRTKVNSKAFAIPTLIAIISNIIKVDAVRIVIANIIELTCAL